MFVSKICYEAPARCGCSASSGLSARMPNIFGLFLLGQEPQRSLIWAQSKEGGHLLDRAAQDAKKCCGELNSVRFSGNRTTALVPAGVAAMSCSFYAMILNESNCPLGPAPECLNAQSEQSPGSRKAGRPMFRTRCGRSLYYRHQKYDRPKTNRIHMLPACAAVSTRHMTRRDAKLLALRLVSRGLPLCSLLERI